MRLNADTGETISWMVPSTTAVLNPAGAETDWDLFVNDCTFRLRPTAPGAEVVPMEMVGETDCAVPTEDFGAHYDVHFTGTATLWMPARFTSDLVGDATWTDSTGTAHTGSFDMQFQSFATR